MGFQYFTLATEVKKKRKRNIFNDKMETYKQVNGKSWSKNRDSSGEIIKYSIQKLLLLKIVYIRKTFIFYLKEEILYD